MKNPYIVAIGKSAHKVQWAIEELEKKVNGLIDQGYAPQGGLSVQVEGDSELPLFTVMQPMYNAAMGAKEIATGKQGEQREAGVRRLPVVWRDGSTVTIFAKPDGEA